jgi:hypothetical protein
MRGKWDNPRIRDAGTATGLLIIFISELLSLISVRVCGPLTIAVLVFYFQMPVSGMLWQDYPPFLAVHVATGNLKHPRNERPIIVPPLPWTY